jgi:Tfp pilus assembly protein PilO
MANTEERKQLKYLGFLKNPPSKTTMYYLSGFTVLVAILLIAFAIRPTLLTIDRIRGEIKEKEGIYEALDTKIEAMIQLDEQYSELEGQIESLQLIYPTSGNFSLFMSNIEAVVSRNGFSLRGLSFSDYDADLYDLTSTVLSPWSVQISVSGPESNLDNLFDDLQAMPMYPVIDRLSYSEDENDDGSKNFSIMMRIYHIENNKFYSDTNESN